MKDRLTRLVNKMCITMFAIITVCILINTATTKAAVYSFNFTGATEANQGETITLTITANGLTGNVKLSSTNATLSDSQKWVEKNTVSITAKITGFPATVTATPVELTDNDYNIVSIAPKTVTINKKPEVNTGNQGNRPQGGQTGNQGGNNQGSSGNQGQTSQGGSGNQEQTNQNKPTQNQGGSTLQTTGKTSADNQRVPNQTTQTVTKSSNNYLKSLSTNIGTITPEFYRETYHYTINDVIENDIEVFAEAEDDKAAVSRNRYNSLSRRRK